MPDDFSLTLKGVCKQCGFDFKSIRSHLHHSPKCRDKYETDYNPEYILSGPCWSCGKVFKCIPKHLAKAPQCIAAYNVEELMEARKLARSMRCRKYNKEYYAANSEKIKNDKKMYYENNCEQINKYIRENRAKIKAIKKWKLDNQEKN